jgi:hypothetical protein
MQLLLVRMAFNIPRPNQTGRYEIARSAVYERWPQDTTLHRPSLLVSKEMAWTELWMHLSILTQSRTVIFESFVAVFQFRGLCSSRLMYVCRYLGKGTSLKGMVTRDSMDTKEVRLHAGGEYHL